MGEIETIIAELLQLIETRENKETKETKDEDNSHVREIFGDVIEEIEADIKTETEIKINQLLEGITALNCADLLSELAAQNLNINQERIGPYIPKFLLDTGYKNLTLEEFSNLMYFVLPNNVPPLVENYLAAELDGKTRYQTLTPKEFLDLVYFVSAENRSSFVENYLAAELDDEKTRYQILTPEQFSRLMRVVQEDKVPQFVENYLAAKPDNEKTRYQILTVEDFLNSVGVVSPSNRTQFVEKYLTAELDNKKTRYQTLDIEELLYLISAVPNDFKFVIKYLEADLVDGTRRIQTISHNELCMALAYLNSWQDVLKYVEEQKKDFALPNQKIVIEFIISSDAEISAFFLAGLLREQLITIENLAVILRQAYGNDLMLVEFVVGFINNDEIPKEWLDDGKRLSLVKKSIELITDNEAILDIIEAAKKKELFVGGGVEILELIKDIYIKILKLSKEVLSRASVNSLPEEGLKKLKDLFGDSFDPEQYNLGQILSYYYVQNNQDDFFDLLGEELKSQLKDSFKLPDDVAFFTEEDYNFLCILFGDVGLLEFQKFCTYLADRKVEISDDVLSNPVLNLDDISFIRMEGEEDLEKAKSRVTALFQTIIKKEKIDKKEVLNFLRNFFNEEDWKEISKDNKKKIYKTFTRSPKETAFLFSQPGALSEFISEATTAEDGCVKNFSAKFDAMLARYLMPNAVLAALYNFYLGSVFTPLLQLPTSVLGDVTHGGDRSNDVVLRNEIINEQILNPAGFLAGFIKYLEGNNAEFDRVKECLVLSEGEEKFFEFNPELLALINSAENQEEKTFIINQVFTNIIEDDVFDNEEDKYTKLNQYIAFCAISPLAESIGSTELQEWFEKMTQFGSMFSQAVSEIKESDIKEIKEALEEHRREQGDLEEEELVAPLQQRNQLKRPAEALEASEKKRPRVEEQNSLKRPADESEGARGKGSASRKEGKDDPRTSKSNWKPTATTRRRKIT